MPNTLPPRPLVITGTGTDVGKTYVSERLLAHLRSTGTRPLGLKPVETGYAPATSDARALALAAGHALIVPAFTAAEPLSPHRAARRLGTRLSVAQLATWVRSHTATTHEPCVVETAGGLFSPLNEHQTMLDLVRALEPCFFLLVAADRLGTLHDIGAALHAARALHRVPDLVLLNPKHPNDLENAAELARIAPHQPIEALNHPQTLPNVCSRAFGRHRS